MFEEQHCGYCERWKAEVGVIYHKTAEGRRAPLTQLDIHEPIPQPYAGLTDLQYTPTFVVWHNNHEIGRITGYPGEDFFWGLLNDILKKVPLANANE